MQEFYASFETPDGRTIVVPFTAKDRNAAQLSAQRIAPERQLKLLDVWGSNEEPPNSPERMDQQSSGVAVPSQFYNQTTDTPEQMESLVRNAANEHVKAPSVGDRVINDFYSIYEDVGTVIRVRPTHAWPYYFAYVEWDSEPGNPQWTDAPLSIINAPQNADSISDSPEQMENLVRHANELPMPEFVDDDGQLWMWDPTSHTYVKGSKGLSERVDRGHASGGDNNLFDPVEHTFVPKNPLKEGILANNNGHQDDCPCQECEFRREMEKQIKQHSQTGPFYDRATKPSGLKTDNSYPSMALSGYKNPEDQTLRDSAIVFGVNVSDNQEFSHFKEEAEHRLSNASLDMCPECGGPMTNHRSEAVCHQCGHRQPVVSVEAKESAMRKEAFIPALLAAARVLAPRILGSMAARGAAGAAAGEAAGAGAGGAAGAAGGAGALSGGALKGATSGLGRSLLNSVGRGMSFQAGKDLLSGSTGGNQNPIPPSGMAMQQGTHASIHTSIEEEIFATKNRGDDSNPGIGGTGGYNAEHGDAPELLKDVDDVGGSYDYSPEEWKKAVEELIGLLTPQQRGAVDKFDKHFPTIMMYAVHEDMDGSDHPDIVDIKKLWDEAFPEGEEEGEEHEEKETPKEEKEEHKEESSEKQSNAMMTDPQAENDAPCPVCGATGPCPHKPAGNRSMPMSPATPSQMPMHSGSAEWLEKVSARIPKNMCPFHRQLVDHALAIGDAGSALSALNSHMFGEQSCQGGWAHADGKKCKYKPAMVTQKYWDDKDEAAAERKRLREEALRTPSPDVNEMSEQDTQKPEDSLEVIGEGQTPESTEMALDGDSGYSAPVIEMQPSAVGAGDSGMQMAAAVEDEDMGYEDHQESHGSTEHWKDADGNPLEEGQSYMLKAPTYEIPDHVTINEVHPDKIMFTIHTDMMDYQDEMDKKDLDTEGYTFEPTKGMSDEEVDKSEDFTPETNDDNNMEGSMGHEVSDLADTDTKVSHDEFPERSWLWDDADFATIHMAGRDYSPREQRDFINESGTARNLDRLDIAGTHYVEEHSLDDDFLW